MRTAVSWTAIAVLAATVCGCGASPGAAGSDAAVTTSVISFYVSPAGSDGWSGRSPEPGADRRDGPYRTLERARRAVRELKAGGTLAAPVVVNLRGGTYELAAPLVLTPDDSGTAACPITWMAYRGETAVLSGGSRVTGFQSDEKGRWVADLSKLVPEGRLLRQVFVNGGRRYRPRVPREGFNHVKGPLYLDKPYGTETDHLEFHDGELKADWRNLEDVEVTMMHFWVCTRLPIKSIDSVNRVAHFAAVSHRRFTLDHLPNSESARYWVENVFEALAPAQWYQDRKTGKLHYFSMTGENPETAEVLVSRLSQLVRLEGDPSAGRLVEHLRLQGLTFSYTDWNLPPGDSGDSQSAVEVPGAIWMRGARSCAVENCTLRRLGTYAIELEEGCRDVRIIGNEMYDLGGGGIKISGGEANSPEALRTRAIVVTDNSIHDGGMVWYQAMGVLLRHASDCVVAHNEVYNLYQTGISVGWVWNYRPSVATGNRIEFNHVHHIGRGMSDDLAGIYTLGPSPGTVVRNNVVHDIVSHGVAGHGLYTDEGSTGILFENNLVYRATNGSFSQHYGKENVFRNNIFALSDGCQLRRVMDENHRTLTCERNIVYWNTGRLLGGNWWGSNYKIDHNLYWNAGCVPTEFSNYTWEAWKERGNDTHSLVADPLFEDPAHDNFRLKPDSPAFTLGFKPFDTSTVGPRKPQSR